MASTNKTPNYNLPQWVATDKPERTDFNQAMSDIDSNLNLVQSGGLAGAFASMPFVGTAPIVESGSNANGSWIKYADGTMFCSASLPDTPSDIASAALYRTENITWTFPALFQSPPTSISGSGLGSWLTRAGAPTISSVILRFYSDGSRGSTLPTVFAIGRWKD